MKITIIKQNKRFQVKCCFSYKVFPIITKFKKAYFDMSTRIWYLPADDFTSFINDLQNDANAKKFDIILKQKKTKSMLDFQHSSPILKSLWYLLVESTTQKRDKLLWTKTTWRK